MCHCIVTYSIFRPDEPASIIPHQFAQVPEKPKLIAEFTVKFHLRSMTGLMELCQKVLLLLTLSEHDRYIRLRFPGRYFSDSKYQ